MKQITAIFTILILEASLIGNADAQQVGVNVHTERASLKASVTLAASSLSTSYAQIQISGPLQVQNTFVVTTADDAGSGSLRDAITKANASPGLDMIMFAIGAGSQTIHVVSNLPFITDPVILDATTQPGYSGKPIIELDGTHSIDYGLRVTIGPSTIKGLVINRFPLGGIVLGNPPNSQDDSITVQGCYVGTDMSGTQALPNGGGTNSSPDEGGIILFYSGNNIIGGKTAGSGNVVSGNNGPGITITGNGATGNQIYGNYAGVDASGLVALPNHGPGLELDGNANYQTIGDNIEGAGNLFSGNNGDGILLYHLITGPNRIRGNQIGIAANEIAALPNGGAGIFVDGSNNNTIGATLAFYSNTISSNSFGIWLDSGSTGNIIEGNDITSSPAKSIANTIGIYVKSSSSNTIGGTGSGAGNTIAHNQIGVKVESCNGVSIRGNSIFSNDTAGIRLASLGNNLQPAPRLDSAFANSSVTTLYGALQGTPNNSYTIDVYSNGRCDPSGFGEGYYLLISLTVVTNASGLAPIKISIPHTGQDSALAALATDQNGNTSQFSNCLCCPIVRIPFSPITNGFIFGNSQSNMWPASITDTIDYTKSRFNGLRSILTNLGFSAQNTDFPSWDLWAEAFGNNAVYLSASPTLVYKARAIQLWRNHKGSWSGSCEGFSLASLLEVMDPTTFPNSWLDIAADGAHIINKYFCYQYGVEGSPYTYPSVGTPAQMVDSLRRSFKRDPMSYQPLCLISRGGLSGHSVVAFKIACGTSSLPNLSGEVDSVFVYDSNNPADNTRVVLVYRDAPNGFWKYSEGLLGFGTGFYPDVEIGSFANGMLPTLPNIIAPKNGKIPIPLANDPSANIYFGDSAFVSVADNASHEINTLDSLTGNIPGCAYLIPRTGGASEIQGFHFDTQDPQGWRIEYQPEDTARMNYLNAASSSLSMDAHFAQADVTGFKHFAVNLPNQSLGIRSETASKNFGLSLIWDSDQGENSLHLVNSSLSQNDSAWFVLQPATSYLQFQNVGTAKNYGLALRRATSVGEVNEQFGPIGMEANVTHTLKVANWDSLSTTKITIDVDRHNNGVTDSVIVLQQGNAATVGQPLTMITPFTASPNPFRDMTVFEFTLAASAPVSLTIVDAVGRSVATIVNRTLPPGHARYEWHAEDLPRGVYFYRFEASGELRTGELLLSE